MSINIDEYAFEFWDGPPPQLPQRKLTINHRPGVSGVAHQILGTWGDTFTVMLTSHHPSFASAAQQYQELVSHLVGNGGHNLWNFEGVNWSGTYGVKYHVEAVECVDIRAAKWLFGPTYDYQDGASLVVRMTLTPQAT